MNKLFLLLITLLFNPFLTGENDPFEEINRATLKINKTLDKAVATPVANFYKEITPDILELGIYNSISNIDDINIYKIIIWHTIVNISYGIKRIGIILI